MKALAAFTVPMYKKYYRKFLSLFTLFTFY